MSENVDTRIVEMQFDDAQFKAGVKETIQSIKELDDSLELENGSKGFEKIAAAAKKLDVSNIADGVDEVRSKFQGLEKIAVGAINSISSVMKGGLISGGIVGALTSIPAVAKSISGGMTRASKLAQSAFQFEGLGVTGSELNKLMERVSQSVNDTAYGLDDASQVASMLFASGVQNVDQLGTALDNVANVAATFNAEYSSIANVMSKVASKGYMQGEEFNQLAHAGMNARAVIAEYLRTEEGAAKYQGLIENFGNTEDAIFEMSKKGAVSFELFNDALSKFQGNAQKSNETLSGVTANIGSALSRTTADFFQYTLHNTEGVIALLNQVRFFINDINKATNDLMHVVKDGEGNIVSYGTVIQGVLDVLGQVTSALNFINNHNIGKTADGLSVYHHRWKTFFSDMQPLLEGFFNRVSSMAYHVVKGVIKISSVFREAARIIVKLIKPIAQAFDEVFGDGLTNFAHMFDQTIGEIIRFLRALNPSTSMLQALHDIFKVLFTVIEQVSKVITGAFIAGFEIALTVLEAVFEIVEVVVQVFLAFADAISPITKLIGEFFGALTSGQNEAGEGFLGMLKDICLTVRDFVKQIQKGIPEIKKFFKPLKKEAKSLAREIKASGILDVIKGGIDTALETLGKVLSNIVPLIQNAVEFLAPVGEAIGDTFVKLFEAISNFANDTGIVSFFSDLGSKVADFLGISQAFADTGDAAQEGANGLDAFGQRFGEAAVAARDGAIEFGGHVLDALVAIATTVWNTVSPAIDWVIELFGQLGQIVGDAFANSNLSWDPVLDFFNKVGELAANFFDLFKDGIPSLEDFGNFFGDIWTEAKNLFDNLAPQIGDVLGQIGDSIQATTDGPLGSISGVISTLVENIQKIPEAIANIPSGVGDMFTNIFNGIGGMIKNPFAVEKAWADTGEGGLDEAIGEVEVEGFKLSTAIEKITKFLKDPAQTAKDTMKNSFVGAMRGIGDAINEGLSAISFETITLFIENCKNVILAFSGLWSTIAFVSVLESIREIFAGISQWTTDISGMLESFSKIGSSIAGMFTTIGTTIENLGKAVEKDMASNRFLKYMLGTIAMIGTIVAAIVILGRMDQNELIQGGIAIGAILAVLLIYQVLMRAISKIKSNAGDVATLAGLSGMGLALLMVARAIGTLGKMDPNELTQGGIAAGILMIVLGIVGSVVGKLSSEGLKGAVLLITFGILLKTLALTIVGYAVMPWDTFRDGLIKMALVLGVLAGIVYIVSRSWSNSIKGAAALAILTVTLTLIAGALAILNFATGGDVGTTIGYMIAIAIGLGSMAAILVKLSEYQKGLKKSVYALSVMAGIFMAISAMIVLLNFATGGDVGTAVGYMLTVLVGFMAMSEVLKQVGNETKHLSQTTRAISAMTYAVLAIGLVMGLLAVIDGNYPNSLVHSVIALMLGLAGMAGVIIVISKYGNKLLATVAALEALSACITAVGIAMALIEAASGGDPVSMLAAAGALSITLIVLSAALIALGHVGAQAEIGALAMIEVAGAIMILSAAIAFLGVLPIESLTQGFLGFIGLVAGLVALAIVCMALSEVFITMDIVIAGLGLGLVLIAAAFWLVIDALIKLGQTAPETFQNIIDSKDTIIEAFSTMGEAVASSIIAFFGTLISGIGQGLTEMAEAIEGHGPEIGNSARTIGKALGEGIIFGFGGMVLGIGEAILGGIGAAVDAITGNVQEAGTTIAGEYSEAMADNPELMNASGADLIEQMKEGMEQSDAPQEAGEQVTESIEESAEKAAEDVDSSQIMENMFDGMELPDGVKDQFANMFDSSSFEDLGLDLGSVIPENILSGAGENPIDPSALLGKMNLTTASFDGDAQQVGTGIGNAVSTGAATSMADTSPVEMAVTAQVGAIQNHTGEYQTAGTQSGQAYSTGVNDGISQTDINPGIVANTAKMAAALEPAKTSGTSVGAAFSSGEMTGMSSLSTAVAATAKNIVSRAVSGAGGRDGGYDVGKNMAYGMTHGINNNTHFVVSAVRRMVSQAMEAAKKEADSQSPSRKMMEQGKWFAQGFGIGISMTSAYVGEQASNMAIMAMDEARESFGVMDSLVDLIDWDANPVITPVLDLDDYEAGIRRMNQLDVSGIRNSASWADRVYSRQSAGNQTNIQNTGGNHIEVHLDWHAGTTANQAAMAIVNALENQLGMEG